MMVKAPVCNMTVDDSTDESMIAGEPVPAEKTAGAPGFSLVSASCGLYSCDHCKFGHSSRTTIIGI